MAHDLEGICDVCGSSGLAGDHCPCGGLYHDLNVGVDDTLLDDEPDAYPKSALKDDDTDVISLESLEEVEEEKFE